MIETERLRLRPFTLDDAADHHRLVYGDAEAVRYVGSGRVRTLDETAKLVDAFIAYGTEHSYTLWATETHAGEFLGQSGLMHLSAEPLEVEVVYAFGRPYWGQGYATEAARACLRYGFEVVGLPSITALAYPENKASQRVMEKIGMRYEGTTSAYYDLPLVVYRLAAADFDPGDMIYRVVTHDRD